MDPDLDLDLISSRKWCAFSFLFKREKDPFLNGEVVRERDCGANVTGFIGVVGGGRRVICLILTPFFNNYYIKFFGRKDVMLLCG